MILTDYFYPEHDLSWDLAVQCGVRHGVIRLPESPEFNLTDIGAWNALCQKFRSAGISPLVLEPIPNCLHDHIKVGDSMRDESIEVFLKMLPLMQRCGITTVCFNFMAYVGWLRTSCDILERGGALVTGFCKKDAPLPKQSISSEQLWANYTYFIKAVIPEAERCGIKLALHPDDPPLQAIGGVSRIFTSYDAIRKAINVVSSPNLGVTFCQATYHMMGEDPERIVPLLGDKIFFIHFRNCAGTLENFHETFHDSGELDMARMITLYRNQHLNVPIRVDHVPLMASETNDRPGYTSLGRLYAIGYLKGLLEMDESYQGR